MEISSANTEFLDAAVARGVFPSREAALDQAVSLLRERQRIFDRFAELAAKLPEPPAALERRERGVFWIRGHRISLHLLLEYFFAGERAEQLGERFPTISADYLRQVLDYAWHNEAALREYSLANQACCRLLESEARSAPGVDALRVRFAAAQTGTN